MLRTAVMTVLMAGTVLAAHAEDVSVMGAVAVYDNIFKNDQAKLEEMTGDKYNVVYNSAGKGLDTLVNGTGVDIAMVTSDFGKLLKKVGAEGKQADYTYTKIDDDASAFAVHPDNKVKDLNREQIVGILTGKISNWNEVGGDDAPIVFITMTPNGGPFRAAVQHLLDGKEPTPTTMRNLPVVAQVVPAGEQLPNVLTMTPASLLKGSKLVHVAPDADSPMPQGLVVKGAPTPAYTRLVDAVKKLLASR